MNIEVIILMLASPDINDVLLGEQYFRELDSDDRRIILSRLLHDDVHKKMWLSWAVTGGIFHRKFEYPEESRYHYKRINLFPSKAIDNEYKHHN